MHTWKLISTQFICKLCVLVCVFFVRRFSLAVCMCAVPIGREETFEMEIIASCTFSGIYNFLMEPRKSNNKIRSKNRKKCKLRNMIWYVCEALGEDWMFSSLLWFRKISSFHWIYMYTLQFIHWRMKNNRLPWWAINSRLNYVHVRFTYIAQWTRCEHIWNMEYKI